MKIEVHIDWIELIPETPLENELLRRWAAGSPVRRSTTYSMKLGDGDYRLAVGFEPAVARPGS